MNATPDPVPRPDRPLSRRGQHALAALEAEASAEDPGLSVRMRRGTLLGHTVVSTAGRNIAVQAAVVLMILAVVLPGAWTAALLTTLMLTVPVFFLVRAARRGDL